MKQIRDNPTGDHRKLQQTEKFVSLKELHSPKLSILADLYAPNMTGYSGTQFQSSLIQSNSDACKPLSTTSGHNILTKEVTKESYSEIKMNKQEKNYSKNKWHLYQLEKNITKIFHIVLVTVAHKYLIYR